MADNIQLNVGTGGDKLAAGDLGSNVKLPKTLLVNADGVAAANRISSTSFNSRDAATLAASATFQGVGEDVSMFGRVGVSIVSDNATDGVLTMEVSRDNVTWGGPTRTWADTRFAQPHMWVIVEKYFRIKYVNGTTEATNLAIQTHYATDANILLGHQLDETLLDETEAIVVRSVGVATNPSGTYINSVSNPEGHSINANYKVEIARGNITGSTGVRVNGRNPSVGTTEQVLSGTSGALAFPTAAVAVRIKSGGNANDTAAGSGAREVTVLGVDGTGAVVTETIATNGATVSSATTATFLRVNDVWVSQGGTYSTGAIAVGANTGVVNLETTGGVLLATIGANFGRGARAIYSIPAGKKGYFERIRVTPEGSKAVTFRLWTRRDYDDTTAPMRPKMLRAEWVQISASEGFDLIHPFELLGKEEVWVSANTNSGTSAASVAFEIQVVDD